MKILIINGPNINVLHLRDPKYYGSLSLEELNNKIRSYFPEDSFEFFQSNHEGAIIDKILAGEGFDGLVINPAAYSHTSLAIKDTLEIVQIPKIEVHLSNILQRESYRQGSITASSCDGVICGLKEFSYIAAIYSIKNLLKSTK